MPGGGGSMIGELEERSDGAWFRRGLGGGARLGRGWLDGCGALWIASNVGDAMPKLEACCEGALKGGGSGTLGCDWGRASIDGRSTVDEGSVEAEGKVSIPVVAARARFSGCEVKGRISPLFRPGL